MSTQTTLTLDGDLHGFFQDLVTQTLDGRVDRPTPVIEQYLVSLLEASAKPGESVVEATLCEPLAVQLSQALHAPAHQRFARLVRLGDGILVLGGLFEPHIRRNGLDEHYVTTLGAKAYSAASGLMAPSLEASSAESLDVLGRLAAQFGQLMALLRDVSDTILARSAKTASDWARLLERWLTQRSAHLERLLRSQGIQITPREAWII